MSKVCSACRVTVERHLCHKNRYGEYICRACARDGVEFTWRGRLRHSKTLFAAGLAVALILAGLLVLEFQRGFKGF